MTLAERLDHCAAAGYQFEICAEAAAEIRRLETLLRAAGIILDQRAKILVDLPPVWP